MTQNTQVEIENRHFCPAKTKVMSVHRHLISIYWRTIWKVRSRDPSSANLKARKYSEYSDKQMSTCPALPLNLKNNFLFNVNMIDVAICYQNSLDYGRYFKNRADWSKNGYLEQRWSSRADSNGQLRQCHGDGRVGLLSVSTLCVFMTNLYSSIQ